MRVLSIVQIRKLYPGYEELNATEIMWVRINAGMAEYGAVNDPNNCLVAWGIKLGTAQDWVPFIFRKTAFIVDRTLRTITKYSVPVATQNALNEWDKTRTIEPGLYPLAPPCVSARLGVHNVGKKSKRSMPWSRRPALGPRYVEVA